MITLFAVCGIAGMVCSMLTGAAFQKKFYMLAAVNAAGAGIFFALAIVFGAIALTQNESASTFDPDPRGSIKLWNESVNKPAGIPYHK